MSQSYNDELNALQKELTEIKKLFDNFTKQWQNINQKSEKSEDLKNLHTIKNMHPDPNLNEIMDQICRVTDSENRTGTITYLGVFNSDDRQSNWIQHTVNTDDLLSLIENKIASTVLQCIGNNDRLNLLLTILKTPLTVSSMVEKCNFNTTGQVYHHLKPLIAADIVFELEQGERGVYAVKPYRVQGIIMLLSGIADLVNTKYSKGDFN